MNAAKRTKRVALYVRVSTDHQTIKNQERELEAVAERHGWSVVAVFKDQGISGAKGRAARPGLDKLLQGVVRREFDLVAAWSVDRLGRSLLDLVQVLQELHGKGIDLYLHQQGIDTTTLRETAMFQVMGVLAKCDRSIIHERVGFGAGRGAEGTQLGAEANCDQRYRRSGQSGRSQGGQEPSGDREGTGLAIRLSRG
jgi:DNA invertase Pin-like site-specific DNA recombinase